MNRHWLLSGILACWLPAGCADGARAPLQANALCEIGETVAFSCHLGKKQVSLCQAANAGKAWRYRYGTPAKIELAFPEAETGDAALFSASEKPTNGGANSVVSFARGGYEYRVFSRVAKGEDGEPTFEDGLEVVKDGKLVSHRVCDDGGEGFRVDVSALIR
ncbi:hypothetical protein [Nevskia sp.]|uniref:hypothetical protein n=1 Tax=Nevskia sp. TaxID=1929292 RepID=UPI0025D3DEDE|nr:hypothetical protein [Nevskia sp.]